MSRNLVIGEQALVPHHQISEATGNPGPCMMDGVPDPGLGSGGVKLQIQIPAHGELGGGSRGPQGLIPVWGGRKG